MVGRLGVEEMSKKEKDSWMWTTVWRLWGEGSVRGLNGEEKKYNKKIK